ncbi:MAG: hypothetical protein DWG80_04280 [Chloroflexi bacterium]|nr:hypothetical protein [Chloroflexota bacterium]
MSVDPCISLLLAVRMSCLSGCFARYSFGDERINIVPSGTNRRGTLTCAERTRIRPVYPGSA